MPARISITSNPQKLRDDLDMLLKGKKEKLNEAVIQYVMASFELTLANTPADTGQLMSNWRFYITRGSAPFQEMAGYESRRHDRYDFAGRTIQQDISRREQMALIQQEMRASGIDFFKEGRKRITVGIRNAAPYFNMLDEGLYTPNPPLVNLTADGYSIQAPNGIITVSLRAVKAGNDFTQFVGVRGAHG